MTNYTLPKPAQLYLPTPAKYTIDDNMHEQIQYLLSQYCFCPEEMSTPLPQTKNNSATVEDLVIKLPNRPIKARKKTRLLHSRSVNYSITCLQHIINNTPDMGDYIVQRSKKSRNNAKINSSTRRSHFIGVSKNGDVWQALIMIDKKKTYIGTYHSENEAAVAYDFYAIALKHLGAKTNFDYTLSDIKNMVVNYYNNQGVFSI
jgi:hypothetical protein